MQLQVFSPRGVCRIAVELEYGDTSGLQGAHHNELYVILKESLRCRVKFLRHTFPSYSVFWCFLNWDVCNGY